MACEVAKGRHRHHHALAVPLPGQGHLNAMMRFCKRLAAQEGFTITFVHINSPPPPPPQPVPSEHPAAIEGGKQAAVEDDLPEGCGRGLLDIRKAHISMPILDQKTLGASGAAGFMEIAIATLNGIAPQLEDLLLQPYHPPITCLISDTFITGPTQSVADKFKLPRIALYPCSQSLLLLANYIREGTVPLDDVLMALEARERLKDNLFKEGLPGLPPIKVRDLVDHITENRFLYTFGFQAWQETASKAHAIAINTSKVLEEEALKVNVGIPIYDIGPLVEPLETEMNTSLWKEDEACMSWLDSQPRSSVLFISFGTSTSLSLPQFQEFVTAILSSEKRFLWVFRADLVKDAPFTTFPEDLLSKSSGKGYATHWAPQAKVLSHPSVHGFLTHCGWNSTLEAISHGVPMLCYPFIGDQFLNAKFIIEEWKIGLGFNEENTKNGVICKEEIQRVIQALFCTEEGECIRNNAKAFQEACALSHLPKGHAFNRIQSLVQSLK